MGTLRHRQRGFTLLELMITGVIASVAIAAVGTVFLSQVRLYQQHENRRSSQASARLGLAFMEQRLREAGYGVEPQRAVVAYDSYDAAADNAGVNFPDAIAVHSRNTTFARTLTGAAPAQVTFAEPLKEPVRPGQIVLAVCRAAAKFGYGVVSAFADVGATRLVLGGQSASDSPTRAPTDLFANTAHEAASLAEGCFSSGSAQLFLVDRTAFYLAAFDDDRNAATPDLPYLMLHRGVDTNGDNTVNAADAVPLAAGVEQLQFAYILNTTSDAPPTIVGVSDAPTYGTGWSATQTGGPKLETKYDDAARLTNNPANIRQIRATVVARGISGQTDKVGDDADLGLSGPTLSDGSVPWKSLENLGNPVGNPVFSPEGGGHARTILRLSVAPKNFLMRTQFQSPARGGG